MKNIYVFLLFLFLTACVTKDLETAINSGAKRLTSQEISDLLTGSVINAKSPGFKAELKYFENGKLSGKNSFGEDDKGFWKVEEDLLCQKFRLWGQKANNCYQIFKQNDIYKNFNNKGKLQYSFTILEKGSYVSNKADDHSKISSKTMVKTAREESLPAPPLLTEKTITDVSYLVRNNAMNCPGCNFVNSNLSGINLMGANLEGANLAEADFSSTNLRRANLKGANLYKANLRNANLAGAELTGANLTGALLDGANLNGAVGINNN